jgi:hypothetical protein
MYQLIKNPFSGNIDATQTTTQTGFLCIPFSPANTDYMAFKLALQTGKNADGTAVELQDATGATMTSAQITAFLETLP